MIPAMAMMTRRITRTMAVAGRTCSTMADHRIEAECPDESDGAPAERGPHLHEGGSVPWGGLGGYPFTPWTNVP